MPTFRRRFARTNAAAVTFLVVFVLGLGFLSVWYIIPALKAFHLADRMGNHEGRKAISATAALVLYLVLFVLVAGILLTVRIGRFFFPRKLSPRTRTSYPDAWEESARRMPTPPPEDESND